MKNKLLLVATALFFKAFTSFAQLNYTVSKTTGNAFAANPTATTTSPVAVATTTVTVGSTTGISKGMVVNVITGTDASSQGVLPLDCRVVSVLSATQFTISVGPTTAIATGATLGFNQLVNKGRDDHGSCETVIGFPFNFGGVDYYTFSANADGFMVLGNPTFVNTTVSSLSATTTINAPIAGLAVGQCVVVQSGTGFFAPQTRITAIGATSFTVNVAPITPLAAGAVIRALNMQTAMGTQCQPSGATTGSPQGTLTGPWYNSVGPVTCNYTVSAVNPRACGNCDNNGGGLGSWFVNNMTTTVYLPMITPLWDDWVTNSTTGSVSYQVLGAAGSRYIVVEWKNMARWPQYTATAYSFQAILYQNGPYSGGGADVEFNYKFEGTVNAITASIGMKSTCAGDQYFLNQANTIDNSSNPSRTSETTSNAFPGDGVRFIWDAPLGATAPTNDKLCDLGTNRARQLVYGSGSCTPFATTTKSATNSNAGGDATYTNCGAQTQDQDVWFYVDVPLLYGSALPFGQAIGNTIMNVTGGTANGFIPYIGQPIFVSSATGSFPAGTTISSVPNASQIVISTPLTGAIPAGATISVGSPIVISTDLVTFAGGACATANGVQFQLFNSNQTDGSAITCPTLGTCILNSDDGGVLDPQNSTTTGVNYVASGKRYYIRVDDDDAVTGNSAGQYYDFQICVKDQFNDGICQAATLTPGTTCNPTLYSTVGATASTTNTGNSCVTGLLTTDIGPPSYVQPESTPESAALDVWFKFTVPNVVGGSQDWVIQTNAGSLTDGMMALYRRVSDCGALTTAANSGPNCSNPLSPIGPMGTYLGAFPNFASTNDNVTTTDIMPRIVATGLTLGATYYIRFWRKPSSASPEGTFGICVYERPTCGVKVTSGCTPPAPTPGDATNIVWSPNPNGNFNGTKCHTPLPVFPLDTNGKCYNLYPKIPTVGTDFAPLCGDNFNSPLVARSPFATSHNPPDGNPVGPTFNQAFCGTSVPLKNPIYYRIKAGATGDLKMDISNQLCGLNLGMRAGLWTLSPLPTSPTYDCSGNMVWNLVQTQTAVNNGLVTAAGTRFQVYKFCNTNSAIAAPGTTPTVATGAPSTGKFTMTWPVVNGNIYYLMMDGNYNATVGTTDKCYFDMTLTGTPVVLPIRLLSFKGISKDGVNVLDWATSSEENNALFTLERSNNGENFEKIAQRDGAGNSNYTINYKEIDKNPLNGVNYYRLRMTDNQGVNTYSEIISVYSSTGKMIEFEGVHPNPTAASVFADFYVNVNTTLSIEIRDVSGKIVKAFNSTVDAGKNSVEADLNNIDNGLYFITVRDIKSGEAYTKRFVKN